MKRIILLCCLILVLGMAFSGCKKATKGSSNSSVTTTKTSNSQADPLKELTDKLKEEELQNQKKEDLVKEFGERWVNFSSVDERNASVKEFLTKECIKANGIDVPVHAEFETVGKITNVYQSTEEEDSYIVFGTEEAKGNRNTIVLNVELESSGTDFLVSKIVVNYVRQAY